MTEKQLVEICKNCINKKIKITCNNGNVIDGVFFDFTWAADNTPEIASIAIKDENGQLHGYTQTEIDAIETLN